MATADTKGFRWGVERRLEFVEFRLFWEGGVNRSDIVDEFGVSVPQASKDLALYQEQALDNIVYDRSEKRYFASDAFRPKFIQLDAAAYLDRLAPSRLAAGTNVDGRAHGTLVADRLPIPQRRIASNALRSLLAAVRGNRSIEIFYQSMNSQLVRNRFGGGCRLMHSRAMGFVGTLGPIAILIRSSRTSFFPAALIAEILAKKREVFLDLTSFGILTSRLS